MKKMTMLVMLMGVILVGNIVNAQDRFLVYKTNASVQAYAPTGASEFSGKTQKVTTYTIIDTTALTGNAYSIWFGKVGRAKVVAGTIYAGDPAFNDYRDMFRGYDTLMVKNGGSGAAEFISSYEAVEAAGVLTNGLGQMYSGKVAKKADKRNNTIATSLKGAYTWYTSVDTVKVGLTVNRTFKYDRKMTEAAEHATTMNEAASAVVDDMHGYASRGLSFAP